MAMQMPCPPPDQLIGNRQDRISEPATASGPPFNHWKLQHKRNNYRYDLNPLQPGIRFNPRYPQ